MNSSNYTKGPVDKQPISTQSFKEGSYVYEQAERLTEAGVAGVEYLGGAEVQRLATGAGLLEVEAALGYANKIAQETGVIPEVNGIDLVHLARLAQACKYLPHNRLLAENAAIEREKLYQKIAQAAGAIAVENSESAS